MKKYFVRSGAMLLVLILVVAVSGYLFNPELAACVTINFSDSFIKHDNGIFISKDTPKEISHTVLFLLKKANKRVCDFWNIKQRKGDPQIIFCYSRELYEKYSRGAVGKTLFTPLGAFVIIGMNFIDLDKISHEICHTELFSRLGYLKISQDIPTWFDEGLALQVDYRKEYSKEKYLSIIDSMKSAPDFNKMDTPEKFYDKDYYIHFLKSGYEVGSWFSKVGNKGLLNLIDGINKGEDFKDLYSNEE